MSTIRDSFHPWRNHEREKLEDAHAIGFRGVLPPFGAFLKIS